MKTSVNLFLSFFLLPQIVNAFDVTQILNRYPEFSSFNNYLTQSKLSSQINSRGSVTVLVVENSKLFPVSGKPPQIIANILSVHVLLDYFDIPKLQSLNGGPTTITTLFQTTGRARGRQGFLNVTSQGKDGFAFGSSVPRPTPTSNLVRTVFTEAYNISVLQISGAILPPGIDGPALAPTGPQPMGLTISPAASQSPKPAATSPGTSQAQPPSTAPPTSSGGSRSTASPATSPGTSQAQTPSAAPPTSSGGSRSTAPSGSSKESESPSMSPRGSQITISPSLSQGNASKDDGGTPTGAADSPGATPGSSGGDGPPASDSEDDAPPGKEAPPGAEETASSLSKSAAAGRANHGGLAVVCTVAAASLFLAMRV